MWKRTSVSTGRSNAKHRKQHQKKPETTSRILFCLALFSRSGAVCLIQPLGSCSHSSLVLLADILESSLNYDRLSRRIFIRACTLHLDLINGGHFCAFFATKFAFLPKKEIDLKWLQVRGRKEKGRLGNEQRSRHNHKEIDARYKSDSQANRLNSARSLPFATFSFCQMPCTIKDVRSPASHYWQTLNTTKEFEPAEVSSP